MAFELARSETRPYEDVPPLPLMAASLETLSCPRVAVDKGLQHKGGCGQVCSGVVAPMGRRGTEKEAGRGGRGWHPLWSLPTPSPEPLPVPASLWETPGSREPS